MLLIVCEFIFFLLQYYEVSTVSLQTPYRPSTAYYGLSTDSLHSTMDSLQTLYTLLWTLYRLSTASTVSLQSLYSLYMLRTARPDGPAGVMGRTLRYVLLNVVLK